MRPSATSRSLVGRGSITGRSLGLATIILLLACRSSDSSSSNSGSGSSGGGSPSVDSTWSYIGPFAASVSDLGETDPLGAFGGVMAASKVPEGSLFPSELVPGGRVGWQGLTGQGSENWVVVQGTQHGSFQGWVRGRVNVMKSTTCTVFHLQGSGIESAWLASPTTTTTSSSSSAPALVALFPNTPTHVHGLQSGSYDIFVRLLTRQQAQFRLALKRCRRSDGVRLLDLHKDNWDKGHEVPDLVEGRLPDPQHVFLRLDHFSPRNWLANVSLEVVGSDFVLASSSLTPLRRVAPGPLLFREPAPLLCPPLLLSGL